MQFALIWSCDFGDQQKAYHYREDTFSMPAMLDMQLDPQQDRITLDIRGLAELRTSRHCHSQLTPLKLNCYGMQHLPFCRLLMKTLMAWQLTPEDLITFLHIIFVF